MKKLFKLALVGTMVLAAAACQREQVGGLQTPENGVKEVTTQFVLNVTAAPKTKMTADVVQQNNNFRGIQDGIIYTFKTGIDTATAIPYVINPAWTADKTFEFPFFFAENGLNNTGTNNQTGTTATASKRVLQLSIPVGTDAVLFYGKAIKATGVADSDYGATDTDENTGTVISGTPNNTVIKAKKILNDTNRDAYDRTGDLMIYLINDVLGTHVDADDSPGTIGNYQYTKLPALSWAQLGHQYEIDNYPSKTRYTASQGVGHKVEGLEEVLGKCYYLFTYLTPSEIPDGITYGSDAWKTWVANNPTKRHHEEYRSGSSRAVKSMIIDMYKIINTAATEAEATDSLEANAKRLAIQIIDNADDYFITSNGNFKEISTLKSANIVAPAYWAANFEGAKDLNKYPYETFGIPEGAAQIGFKPQTADLITQPKDEFYYKLPNQPLVNPTMVEFEPKKYLYPAELWYYVNSPIRTSTDGSITTASYPDGVNKWKDENSWSGWDSPGIVASATRAVAVTNSINYGVALLKSSVSYSASNLLDNRAKMTDETTDRVIPNTAANLQLRGVLVGGVNPRMNWQFIRKYESAAASAVENIGDLSLFDGVIYDHSLSGAKTNGIDNPVAVPTVNPVYTLVYDNYCSTGDGATEADNQNDVWVALEFVNGGDSFWGKDNLIPKDGVFYLVAKLHKPTASDSSGISWPTDHQIPPIDANGDSKQVARVFIQDFVTTVSFKIGAESLKNAYYSIPDLRASNMSLGLDVDLKWETGISYELTL